jgi:hypothetical protein
MQNSFSLFFNHYVAHFPFLNRSPHFSTNKSEDHQRGCDWSTVPKRKGVSHWSTMRKGNASGSNLPYFLASKVLARKYNQTKIGYCREPNPSHRHRQHGTTRTQVKAHSWTDEREMENRKVNLFSQLMTLINLNYWYLCIWYIYTVQCYLVIKCIQVC